MKGCFLFIPLFYALILNNQTEEKFYFFTFGCCFNYDSVIVKSNGKIHFNGLVKTNGITGTDNDNFFGIPVDAYNTPIQVTIPSKRKSINIELKKTSENLFFQISYYRDSLYYSCSIKPIRGL